MTMTDHELSERLKSFTDEAREKSRAAIEEAYRQGMQDSLDTLNEAYEAACDARDYVEADRIREMIRFRVSPMPVKGDPVQ